MHGSCACVARCPAKINLALRVLGSRPDGYHELEVLFQAIDLWDRLTIGPGPGLTLSTDAPQLCADASNLVCRAAALVAARHGQGAHRTAHFHLEKRIPIQGGLGGGSADAAAALLLCDRFWGLGLDTLALADLAAELGADVPFFLTGGRALGRGRGDRIEPLPAGATLWLVLGCPPFGISTAEVFARFRAELTLRGNDVTVPVLSAHKLAQGNDFGSPMNDLERVVFDMWPVLSGFKDALIEAGATAALVSGSGSTVYGIFETHGARDGAAERLRLGYPAWRIVRTRSVTAGAHLVAGA
jgi:4-diphosphocytidyl-2-C-methyl-D-erythritol kinase